MPLLGSAAEVGRCVSGSAAEVGRTVSGRAAQMASNVASSAARASSFVEGELTARGAAPNFGVMRTNAKLSGRMQACVKKRVLREGERPRGKLLVKKMGRGAGEQYDVCLPRVCSCNVSELREFGVGTSLQLLLQFQLHACVVLAVLCACATPSMIAAVGRNSRRNSCRQMLSDPPEYAQLVHGFIRPVTWVRTALDSSMVGNSSADTGTSVSASASNLV